MLMFDLVRPCADCPFRKGFGQRYQLQRERLREIVYGSAFQCHKTVEYAEDENGFEVSRPGSKPQQCAGLMAVLHREGKPNQIMQVGERLGGFNPARLDPDKEAYGSLSAVFTAHLTRDVAPVKAKRKRRRKSNPKPEVVRRPRAIDPVPGGL
jgi:hypothetical protein